MNTPSHGIAFAEAFRAWLRISLLSFGGPAGQIAVMHRIMVDEKKWLSESRFLHALNYCMLLPGPEAQQLMTYVGWLTHRTLGGLVAGTLFVLPGFLAILLLSVIYALYGNQPLVQALFFGLKPAVLAIVVQAVFRIGGKALKNRAMVAVAVLAFVGIFFLAVPFPAIVALAGLAGWFGSKARPDLFSAAAGHGAKKGGVAEAEARLHDDSIPHTQPTFLRAVKILAVCLVLWFAPILGAWAAFGPDHVLVQQGLFFSKLAVVTFGGAYAVLGYVAQEAVQTFQWVSAGEMLDGLGMAETTPGPLIMVLEFVGFLAAFRAPAPFDPLVAGVLAAVLTTWVTFVPCYLWIFLGAPYVERLRHHKPLSAALGAITAAVVGVVLNLAVWFGLHVVFGKVETVKAAFLTLHMPIFATLDWAALFLTAGALVATFRFKLGMTKVLGGSALLGAAIFLGLR